MTDRIYKAYDQAGKEYVFDQRQEGGSIFLTLKKEQFEHAEKLYALAELSEVHAGEEGYYIQPRNILQNGDILTRFTDRENLDNVQKKMIMSFYGIKTPRICALIRVERSYNWFIRTTVQDGTYRICAMFDFIDTDNDNKALTDKVHDDIRIEIVPLPLTADYNNMAKAERRIRLERGEIVPLREKCKRPAVEYARKYPLIRIRMGWKESPSPVLHQTLENEPPMFVACTFDRVCEIADELKRQGVEGAELQLVGWNQSGHDGRYPQYFPADARLGGNEGLRHAIDYVKSLGYRISTHTNTIDATEIADCFDWNDVCIKRDGSYLQQGHYSGGLAYHLCPICQLKNAKKNLPELTRYGENGLHFTDVISIVLPDVCFSKEHPCTTKDGIAYALKNIRYTKDAFGAFSSEGCMDFTLGDIDYGLYVTFGDGFGHTENPIADNDLPLWEVVYHGTVLYNPSSPTVNYPIKSPRDRLTFILRGGKPTFYLHSKFRTGGKANWMGEDDLTCRTEEEIRSAVAYIKQGAEEYAPLADKQLLYMEGYDLLGNGLERARYSDGSAIIGNFSSETVLYEGKPVAPFSYLTI